MCVCVYVSIYIYIVRKTKRIYDREGYNKKRKKEKEITIKPLSEKIKETTIKGKRVKRGREKGKRKRRV